METFSYIELCFSLIMFSHTPRARFIHKMKKEEKKEGYSQKRTLYSK